MISNFVKTYDFKNKTIYLIANNKNIKNIDAINNIQLDENSIVVRFNGDRFNLLNKIFKNKCDIMVHTAKPGGFHGFDKKKVREQVQVFAIWNDTLSESTDINFDINTINNPQRDDILSCKNHNVEYFSSKYTGGKNPTIGFAFLMRIIEQHKFNKIFLIGYSNLDISNNTIKVLWCHDILAERLYYNTHIKDKYNIELIL